ncbi:tetratricopeptide repeat protein [Phormidium pseudopriestleyi FRX01]|uniref:Tetratricopeptide repeat protein n=1 Tax=Phormidium pseudopriestleyi FRX01 TaxID=1759528 RepID=A0ABS3FYF1_9CYAN|nr:tetratricopeptide repeat protein [Phormidium pseudopriestleyi]MBO0352162.1 tetratricopeptide repeat protein [Phormidium pseudopriestleyi FRX01]
MTGQESPENLNSPLNSGDQNEEEGLIVIQMNNPKAWYDRAGSLYKLGLYEEALESYEKAVAIDENYADAWNNRGMTLKCLGRHEEAVTSYEQAIALKADYYQGWNNLGNALVELERYEQAVASYQRAILISPEYCQGWHNQGEALAVLERYEEAVACYDRVLALKPTWRETKRLRRTAMEKLQEMPPSPKPPAPEETPVEENIVPESVPTPPVIPLDHPKLAACDRLVERYPDDAEAWVDRGSALAELGCYEEAVTSYDRAISLDPENWQGWKARGMALKQLGQQSEALRSYERALELPPAPPTIIPEPADASMGVSTDILNESPVEAPSPEIVPTPTPVRRSSSPLGRGIRWIRRWIVRLWRRWIG